MEKLIKRLVEALGPSGKEDEVRALVRDEIKEWVDEISVSSMGGLHAIKNPEGSPRVMVAAHLDEIGVVISHVDGDGFARFQPLGGVFPHTLVGHRVRFDGGIVGVIGVEAAVKRQNAPKLEQAFIDFGASSKADCPVRIGAIGAFVRSFRSLGNRYVAKSMDDRIGVAVMIEAIRRLGSTPNQVQFAFTTQEEVGLRGAGTSAFGLDPDVGIAVDVSRTGDTPKARKLAIRLGGGPAIKVRDTGLISDPRVVELMVQRAEGANIPYQFDVADHGRTDATAIQLTRAGVPVGVLSIPCRYVHTPSEMVDAEDVEHCVELLVEILAKPIKLGSPS